MLKQIEPGTVFGHLTVMNHPGSNKHGQAMYGCRCDCGKLAIVAGYKLRRGEAKSCGCKRVALRMATLAEKGISQPDPLGAKSQYEPTVASADKPQLEEAATNA